MNIDVSKCEFAKVSCVDRKGNNVISCEIRNNQGDFFNICNGYKDCYYKQLQQLKQENEELKKKNLRQKNKINKLKEFSKYNDYIRLSGIYNYQQKFFEQAEQKLKKIKGELALIDNCVWYNGKKAYMGDDLIRYLKDKIKQIIESEGE